MNIRPITALALTVLTAAAVLLSGCDPQEGDACKTPGEYWTHVDGSKRVSLSCEPAGIDPDGKQVYRWVKT